MSKDEEVESIMELLEPVGDQPLEADVPRENFWETLDVSRAKQYAFDSAEAELEVRLIRASYEGMQDWPDRPCDCGVGVRQYRMTVGAFQCPECRTIETYAGRVLK